MPKNNPVPKIELAADDPLHEGLVKEALDKQLRGTPSQVSIIKISSTIKGYS